MRKTDIYDRKAFICLSVLKGILENIGTLLVMVSAMVVQVFTFPASPKSGMPISFSFSFILRNILWKLLETIVEYKISISRHL